jgi:prepilin-type N-terminal cleavage/methylation domain-containing protein
MARPTLSRAFSLIELLIVIVILGILAAIIIPQVAGASVEAVKSALKSQLQTIDDVIEVYRVNNAGVLPTSDPVAPMGLAGGWGVLVSGQYLKETPFNEYTGGSVTGGGTTAAAAAAAPQGFAIGWQDAITNSKLHVWASGFDEITNRLSNEP